MELWWKLSPRTFTYLYAQIIMFSSTCTIGEVSGSDESLSLLYMVNVSVWYFVSHTHKVMITLILVVLVLVCWNWCDSYVESFTVEFSLQSCIYDERVWYLCELEGYNHTLLFVSGLGCHNSCKSHYVVLLYGVILSMHILWGLAEVSGEWCQLVPASHNLGEAWLLCDGQSQG